MRSIQIPNPTQCCFSLFLLPHQCSYPYEIGKGSIFLGLTSGFVLVLPSCGMVGLWHGVPISVGLWPLVTTEAFRALFGSHVFPVSSLCC